MSACATTRDTIKTYQFCGEGCLKTLVILLLALDVCSYAQQGAPPATAPDSAQTPPSAPPASGTSSSDSPNTGETGRRFTFGITFSMLGFSLTPGKTTTVDNTSLVSTQYQTTNGSSRIGYGLTGQYRISNHFAVDLSALLRRIGYQLTTTISTNTTTILNGTSTTTTSTTDTHEDTRARLIDIPLELRYYGTGRRPTSPRWFVEAGGAWRWSNGIRTSTDTTDSSGVNTCCTNTPTVPAHRSSIGLVTGAGLQLIDPVGIHVVPEFRYTRWIDQTFDNFSTTTKQNQLEGSISLTF